MKNFRTYELAVFLYKECQKIKVRNPVIRDQFERASLSIVLNLAEGSGKPSAKDRRRFYSFALGIISVHLWEKILTRPLVAGIYLIFLGAFIGQTINFYKNDFNDDNSEFSLPLSVSGGCTGSAEGQLSVFANIASGGKAGQELVVRATVTNKGDLQKTYALNVAGFEDWASSFSLDQNTLSLNPGQSKDVSATLDVNDNAAGSKTFFLEFLSGGELVRQPVTVAVTESSGSGGITGFVTGGNWYLWGIGLLNVLLVVVIIVVAVKVARKK